MGVDRVGGGRHDRFARQPVKQATIYNQVCRVECALQEGGGLGIAQEGVQDIAECAAFRENVGSIPHRCSSERQPAELLHILDGVSEQSGGEEEQQNTHYAEEDAEVKFIAQFVDKEAQAN